MNEEATNKKEIIKAGPLGIIQRDAEKAVEYRMRQQASHNYTMQFLDLKDPSFSYFDEYFSFWKKRMYNPEDREKTIKKQIETELENGKHPIYTSRLEAKVLHFNALKLAKFKMLEFDLHNYDGNKSIVHSIINQEFINYVDYIDTDIDKILADYGIFQLAFSRNENILTDFEINTFVMNFITDVIIVIHETAKIDSTDEEKNKYSSLIETIFRGTYERLFSDVYDNQGVIFGF